MSASYDASLNGASERLGAAKSREQVKAIVEMLVKSTREMRETNKALEDRLTLSKNEISNLQQSLEAIRAESLTDPLTGLGNRKYFDRMIDMAVQNALASGEPLSLLMFDIDHFKSFNDSYGHLTGDQVLRLVGMSLKQTIKGQDITARYGGEEFAVVLPNTALRQALTVADHIRRAVMAKELKKKSTGEILGRVTISVGVLHAEAGRRHRRADRARRRLPLRRQAQRPQPRHLRGRPGIRRRDPEPGGLAASPKVISSIRAMARTHTPCTLVRAEWQIPSATINAGGYGSRLALALLAWPGRRVLLFSFWPRRSFSLQLFSWPPCAPSGASSAPRAGRPRAPPSPIR